MSGVVGLGRRAALASNAMRHPHFWGSCPSSEAVGQLTPERRLDAQLVYRRVAEELQKGSLTAMLLASGEPRVRLRLAKIDLRTERWEHGDPPPPGDSDSSAELAGNDE